MFQVKKMLMGRARPVIERIVETRGYPSSPLDRR